MEESVLPLIPSDTEISDVVVPVVNNDVLSKADEHQDKQSAEQLQKKMNEVVRDPVVSLEEHSDFDLSWKKRPLYNKAKAMEGGTVRGRGCVRRRG